MPRLITSSASSLGVQCVTGRPHCSGGSQATTRICVICSGVKVGVTPGRGSSDNVSITAARNSARDSQHSMTVNRSHTCCHRRRHRPTWCRPRPTSAAISSLLQPSKAKRMIRARCATPCEHVELRASVRNNSCCRSVITTFRAVPGMGSLPQKNIIETGKHRLILAIRPIPWKISSAGKY